MQAVAATTYKPHQRRRGKPLEPPEKPFTRAAARIYARNAQARNARKRNAQARTHGARRKHVARTDDAQHVTRPPQRGQIRVLWSKSINDATARLSLKIGALHAAKRRKGATRAHAQRAKGRGKPSKGRKMYDGGDGSPLTRRQTAYKGAKNGGGGKVDK